MKLPIVFLLPLASRPGSVLAVTCGNGNRGDGICAAGLCCSQWGWCGSTSEYCSGPSSTPPPTPPTLKGDWELCSRSSECANGCCSGTYSGGTLKCTPLTGGYRSDICVGGPPTPPTPTSPITPRPTLRPTRRPTPPPTSPTSALKGDWALCSRSSECANGCCSGTYSSGMLKCTPLTGGYRSDICVGGPPNPTSSTPPTTPRPTTKKPTSKPTLVVTSKPTLKPSPSPTFALKEDWELCSQSSECANGCCSGTYSGGTLKCTPLTGGYRSDLCVGGPPTPPSPTPPTPPTAHRSVDYLNQITGKNTVSGIHNRINTDVNWGDLAQWRPTGPSVFTNYARQITGKTPGMWSGDFLFDYPNALTESRWNMIHEAERQYNAGALVNIMFHTCNPRLRENENIHCEWGDTTNGPQSHLSDDEWSRLVNDGGDLNKNWKERLDSIAIYLQYLKDKNVELMFRPLHEMNQGVFWWGGRPGSQGTRRLYQITHDYLTIHKGLTNLIWVWDLQDLAGFSNELVSSYNPGNSYWDIAALDIYEGFDQWKYEVMVNASNGKPIAIGECDKLPSVTTLNNQPKWSFFMSWSELTFKNNLNTEISSVYNSDRVITLEEMPGWR